MVAADEEEEREEILKFAEKIPQVQAKSNYNLHGGKGKGRGGPFKRPYLFLCYFLELLPAFSCGFQLSYSSVAVPRHEEEGADIPLELEEASWFVSLLNMGVAFGAVFSSFLSSRRRIGRRGCLFLACLTIAVGMALLSVATRDNPRPLFLGRFLAGVGVGVAYSASYVFLHETAYPTHRAPLAALNPFSLNSGAVLVIALGWAAPYPLMPLLSALPPLAFCCAVYLFIPESAVLLVEYGQDGRAREALDRLWKRKEVADKEIKRLKEELNAAAGSRAERSAADVLKEKITLNSAWGLFRISVLAMVQFADAMLSYGVTMAQMAEFGDIINEYLAAMIFTIFLVLGYLSAPYFIDHYPRKFHFIFSGIFAAASLFVLCVTISPPFKSLFVERGLLFTILVKVVPFVAYTASWYFFALGLGAVPFALLGELLEENVRNFGSSLAILVKYGTSFFGLKLFPWMVNTFGIHGFFGLLGIYYLIFTLFYFLFVEETKDKAAHGIISENEDEGEKEEGYDKEPLEEVRTEEEMVALNEPGGEGNNEEEEKKAEC